eukprot:6005480-Lingulodinium_polyedra.AAC.1
MATGAWLSFMDRAWADSVEQLALRHRAELTAEQWGSLLTEFTRGRAHCTYILTMKLNVWQQLPWHLA